MTKYCNLIGQWLAIYVTQRGTWYPSGDLGNRSKSITKGYMEENMKNRQILFKTFTEVEFHGENDETSKKCNVATFAMIYSIE